MTHMAETQEPAANLNLSEVKSIREPGLGEAKSIQIRS